MMWPWRRYDENARPLDAAEVKRILEVRGAVLPLRDHAYLLLAEGDLRRLVADAHRPFRDAYHTDFPDCDDASLCCRADVLRRAAEKGFDLAPAFGEVIIKRGRIGRHALNFSIALDCNGGRVVAYYEPQTQAWIDEFEGSDAEFAL